MRNSEQDRLLEQSAINFFDEDVSHRRSIVFKKLFDFLRGVFLKPNFKLSNDRSAYKTLLSQEAVYDGISFSSQWFLPAMMYSLLSYSLYRVANTEPGHHSMTYLDALVGNFYRRAGYSEDEVMGLNHQLLAGLL
ncbi:MAG: hypothetical protein KDH94_05170, partial [Coxiellaceae bacterium]|nr:hypothetical protein [Coxiellaceae bacterium]